MKPATLALLASLSLAPLPHALAADPAHAHHDMTAGHAAMGNMLSEGTVKKVDRAQGKLTIKHGPLENLDMPPMTMIFRVKDPSMLDRVKAGDNLHFRAERVNGALMITQIELPN